MKWRQQETKTSLPKIKSKPLWASSGKDIAEDWVLPHLSIATAELVTSAAINGPQAQMPQMVGEGGWWEGRTKCPNSTLLRTSHPFMHHHLSLHFACSVGRARRYLTNNMEIIPFASPFSFSLSPPQVQAGFYFHKPPYIISFF